MILPYVQVRKALVRDKRKAIQDPDYEKGKMDKVIENIYKDVEKKDDKN